MIKKILKSGLRHKALSAIIITAAITGGYYGFKIIFRDDNMTRYAFTQARKETIAVSVSGSGQVSAYNQVEIKPKVSGDITYVGVSNGQEVKTGTLIAQLDAKDAQKAVRDAKTNLESAKLSLEKLKKPADALSILQAENSLAQAKESKQKNEDDLNKSYEDGFNNVADSFLDLPTAITGLYEVLFDKDFSASQQNIDFYFDAAKTYDEKATAYKENALKSYLNAKTAYDNNFNNYKKTTRYSSNNDIEAVINETYETVRTIAEAVKNANNLIQFYKDKLTERNIKTNSGTDAALSNLNEYTGKTNTFLINLLSVKNTIKNSKNNLIDADRAIAEKTESLSKLKAGADTFDIQSSELAVKQRENALLDVEEKLADYFIRTPFGGIITGIEAEKGDAVSTASVIATLITSRKLAEISLNEVDIAKIKTNQKATLTFDAIPELTADGQVTEIDAIGTVSQGVVTYNVKISFDAQDERIKPGMSVSAAIIAEEKTNVLIVPNSSIKTQGNMQYVEVPDESEQNSALSARVGGIVPQKPLRRKIVRVGLVNDEFSEIIDGLDEGDPVATRTIQINSVKKQTQSSSGNLRLPGLPSGGTGNIRGSGGGNTGFHTFTR